jgi:hypothetical protein
MERLLPYALPAVVLLSGVGALVMCLLALRYAGPPDSGEDLDDVAHRLFVLRFGHAVAAFCFAGAVVLAVVAFSARPLALAAAPSGSAAAEVEQLRSEVRALETDLRGRLGAMESRLATQSKRGSAATGTEKAEASDADRPVASAREKPPAARSEPRDASGDEVARATASKATSGRKAAAVAPPPAPEAPPPASRPDSPSKELPSRRSQSPSSKAAAGSALPARVAAATPQAFSVHGTRVELATDRPAPGEPASYTVRLFDPGGVPVSGAEVTLEGRLADGSPLVTPLEATGEPGTYRGRLPATGQSSSDLRLRVARRSGRFELPLGDRVVGW